VSAPRGEESAPPLRGLRVVDVSRGFAAALVTQLLADYGAEVVLVEPPGGSDLRAEAAFPLWLRGKKSLVLDLAEGKDRERLRALAERADVLVESFRPGVAERLGLDGAHLSRVNPGLIHTSITGFGTRGPFASWKGYEGIVLAKLGGMMHVAGMAPRRGPAFPSVPYASFSAAQGALIGTLAALYVRERTGKGQRVETSLVQGIAAHDPWEWFLRILCEKYPQAFTPAPPYSERGVPNQGFAFRLLVCLTKDGRWLQFSQTSPHLFRAFMEVLGLAWMFDDPEWSTAPDFETEEKRERFWELMLEAARERTLAEWDEVFRTHPNVWAEVFRPTQELLDHPQMRHNGHVVRVSDRRFGTIEQLAPMVRLASTPGSATTPAPDLDEHGAEVLAELERAPREDRATVPSSATPAAGIPRRPLEGVTVLELGLWYAAPYGTALLADLGARVIKIEPLAGEPMRHIMPVPDAGAIKSLQGKESVALDLDRPEGQEIVRKLARAADLVLMSYRAGVAERLGVDAVRLRAENPRLVYLAAPGYGTDGPCARKPAYAPTIGVASGIALQQAGPSIPHGADLSLDDLKPASIRLNYAAQAPGNADGCAALGVATALLLGLVARERTGVSQAMLTSMLCTTAYAVSDDCIRYEGRAARRTPDAMLYGLSPRYRLYETMEGWIFLAAPQEKEWALLCRTLRPWIDLQGDSRFGSAAERARHEDDLAAALAGVFRQRSAADWERDLQAADVACAELAQGPIARAVITDPIGRDAGFLVEVEHPTYGRHRRLAPIATLSLTPGEARAAPVLGQHTESVLREVGCSEAEIEDLFRRGVVARPGASA
jgi:crotonobetainyl-CoA:carnitine CoA-transferase CaiB-like acyl-CoA transferase